MVRTGIQRLQDNIVFLKSIPLLNKLSNDTLVKIADVFKIVSVILDIILKILLPLE